LSLISSYNMTEPCPTTLLDYFVTSKFKSQHGNWNKNNGIINNYQTQ